MEQKAKKFDQDKAPITLIPRVAIEQEAKAFGYGVKKYGKWNYTKGLETTRLLDAAMRHILAYSDGEDLDPETGLSHLAHARACLAMEMFNKVNNPQMDDRWTTNGEKEKQIKDLVKDDQPIMFNSPPHFPAKKDDEWK